MPIPVKEATDEEQEIKMPIIVRWTKQKVTMDLDLLGIDTDGGTRRLSVSNIDTDSTGRSLTVTFDVCMCDDED